ncbi:hypothetical protein BV22DRAFT_377455 [Leucogyrophana mollusca]|uniref:Uncharacterized protein n=1 Tax=Leucogyrophana mollusca TaxID=85980 RepID=A0ACB8BKQ4_9AGAM|nr:hypothetical protein BV22DRAFT_377455 [Leucogyrophana mollusca]
MAAQRRRIKGWRTEQGSWYCRTLSGVVDRHPKLCKSRYKGGASSPSNAIPSVLIDVAIGQAVENKQIRKKCLSYNEYNSYFDVFHAAVGACLHETTIAAGDRIAQQAIGLNILLCAELNHEFNLPRLQDFYRRPPRFATRAWHDRKSTRT